eukprot:CAMPEP_0177594734 /NCGR_PEP_ID=MMETSP0419_2-20121207/9943_1 /TAXON_ID=582737 /ORGANISM="Tetraselmis sp., Strain GSL018" /LENGTH=292 /DNA_ID=CAMNT_0019086071 /DNA_START=807 /DNA_END=1684 /DNA_ORIENTATION=+
MTTYSVTCSDCLSSPPALDLSKVVQWVVSRIPCAGQATRWPFLVSAVQQVEVLFEMGAEQWCSSSRRWSKYDFLFALELLKFSLRVATLHSHGGRILVDGACTKDGYCAGSRAEARRSESARLEESLAAFARFREAMVPEEAAEGGEEPDAGTDSRSGARASSAGANGVGALLCEGPPEEGGAALYWWNAPDAPSSQHLSGAPPTSEQHGGSAAATGFCSQQAGLEANLTPRMVAARGDGVARVGRGHAPRETNGLLLVTSQIWRPLMAPVADIAPYRRSKRPTAEPWKLPE